LKGRRRVATDFTLPELGEQIESGDVLRVLVKVGDTLAKDQPVDQVLKRLFAGLN